MSVSEVRNLIRELGISPNKRLGQHYLLDEAVANRQVQYANISKSDTVLEIGPGLGILTKFLVGRAKKVIAVEMDTNTTEYLREKMPSIEVIRDDILKVDLPPFEKVVSNIPFNISSPITFRLLEKDFQTGILMYQKEFAQRLTAKKGSPDYSRLSVDAFYRADCEVLETIPRSSFYPPPKVDSSIVRLTPRKPPFKVNDEAHFFRLVRALFNHRRKHIGNSLKLEWKELCDSKEKMERIVSGLQNPSMRVEEMSPEQLGELSNWISEEKFNLGNGHHS